MADNNDTKWNVVWKDEKTKRETVSLPRCSRGQALDYIDGYFSAYQQKSIHFWEYQDGENLFTVKMEKL